MVNLNLTIVFHMLVMFISIFNSDARHQKRADENICGPTINILCVKDVLVSIAKATKTVRQITENIETTSFAKDPTRTSLMLNIEEIKKNKIRSILPGSEYHNRTWEVNNIDKYDLIRLIREENYAIGFLYNSIRNLREKKSSFNQMIDDLFEELEDILQNQFLCQYRNILYVYSDPWITPNRMDSLQFRKNQHFELSSINYYSYSIILSEITRGWMDTIENLLLHLDVKLL